MLYLRQEVVSLALSWVGKNEVDGSYKEIIDIYNSYEGQLPRGTKMRYDWVWCACTWSALAIKLKYTGIMPIEISCRLLIDKAIEMGIWKEDDAYIPSPGDAVLYDWQDNGTGNNTGNANHIGIVVEVNAHEGYFVTVEGNYDSCVKKRTISINGKFIRGYIVPKYDVQVVNPVKQEPNKDIDTIAHEVIAGTWGNNPYRKEQLIKCGYDYDAVQERVNEILNGGVTNTHDEAQSQDQPIEGQVTATAYAKGFNPNLSGTYTATADLYLRNDAGTNKKALAIIPRGTATKCYGFYTDYNGVRWLYIQVTLNGVQYTGFSSALFLVK